jgi:Fuc2NAc and GlcNAc transferase
VFEGFRVTGVQLAAIFLAGIVAGLVLTEVARRLAIRYVVLDHPNERSSHDSVTPRGGGLAIVLAVLAAGLLLVLTGLASARLPGLLLAGLLVALAGLVDDVRGLSVKARLPVHIGMAAVVAWLGLTGQHPGLEGLWLGAVVTLWVAWTLNLFNFMDGIDGLAGAEAAFVMLAGAGFLFFSGDIRWLALMLAGGGACIGFLILNWQPAKIFMGDAGSGFLGFFMAGSAYLSSVELQIPMALWFILGAVFIVDATVTLTTRVVTRQKFLSAHRSHAYQRLARRYASHARVATGAMLVNVLWLLPLASLAYVRPALQWYVLMIAVAPLVTLCIRVGAGRIEGDGS